MRFRRFVADGQSDDRARRSFFAMLSTWRFCKVIALATMIVAVGVAIAMSRFTTNVETRLTRASPQDCSARYAALLDLAELARRDGKSSEVVVRGLSDRGGAMSGCLSTVARKHAG